MRVLNFYNYNHAGNSIDALYVCGGCSGISVLLDNIVNATGLRVRRVSELCTGLTEEQAEYVDKAPQCYGIMLQD
jgi:Tfp pilus assembly PilM family ATPase